MTAAEWTAIAEACERATGPDREIDARIGVAIPLTLPGGIAFDVLRQEYSTFLTEDLPPYTASLDAITAAIGEHLPGWRWSDAGAQIYRRVNTLKIGAAATPALALCAAFARAMSEREGE